MSQISDSERFPERKNPRINGYNYKTPNYYFVTICTHEKKWLFGTPGTLNSFGRIALDGLQEIHKHFPGVYTDKFVVMPNHVHAIIVLKDNAVHLSVIVGQYKSFVSKMIHAEAPEVLVWQASYYDHVIRNQESYEKIWNYIETNPIKWQDDCYLQPLKP